MAVEPNVEQPKSQSWARSWTSLPRIWVFLGYLMPRTIREREFQPSFEDLHQGYLEDLKDLRLKAQSRRLGFLITTMIKIAMNVIFGFWSSVLFMQCAYGAFKRRE